MSTRHSHPDILIHDRAEQAIRLFVAMSHTFKFFIEMFEKDLMWNAMEHNLRAQLYGPSPDSPQTIRMVAKNLAKHLPAAKTYSDSDGDPRIIPSWTASFLTHLLDQDLLFNLKAPPCTT